MSPQTNRSPLRVQNLVKHYRGNQRALDGVSLHVASGEVYGLVGPNGAGKTTLMRILTGLVAPTSGNLSVHGRVGALIESPAFYPNLSGQSNLTLLCEYWGIPRLAVEQSLDRVGLSTRDRRRKFRSCSLGMKQRLGVAAALLGDPGIVVLDEPTNGLDPASIAGMRDIVRDLRDEGCAVLLSSHLMSEVEQVADRVGVLVEGRIVAEDSPHALRGTLSGRRITVRVNDPASTLALAAARGWDATGAGGREVGIQAGAHAAFEVNRTLVEAGIEVSALSAGEESLESAVLNLITGSAESLERRAS